MARKGKEIALQREVETQEDWEDMLSKEGLCVVDVYQEWCGPALGMVGTFRRIKNEIGDDLLKFITAKCDTIDALEKYRGRCEPCFLFFAGGVLVAVIRGANAPLILRTITEQLAQEHKVLDGQAERKEIKDTMIAKLEEQEKQKEEEEAEEEGGAPKKKPTGEPKKEVSVAIIKPDAVQSGKAEEIMEEMKNRGIEILMKEERLLTDDEVKNLYVHLQDEAYFDDLVAFMTSAPSIVLAITKGKTGENIIQEFRELIGPTEVEEAKEQAPDSLRAKFGSDKYMNAVHGADSQDTAARELAFFFPDFVAPTVEGKPKLQRTLALIRPDAYKNSKDQILGKIRESGFKVAMQKEIHLTKEQAEDFYSEHQGQEYFDELTTRMSSGPLLALGLAREEAIDGWRQMLGPTLVEEAKEQQPDSLRAQFAEEGASINMLHGSDTEEKAQKEIEFFFPMEQTLAVIKPDAYGTKDDIINKIHEAGFRIAARKETTLSREIAEEFYGDHKDKEYYNELVEHMCSGPTYFMVLSREGAVDGWRSLIGPTDPSQAKEVDPETIRGTFGQDTLRNAVHGSSNKEQAMQNIERIFGELYFNKDGTVREDKEVPGLVSTKKKEESAGATAPSSEESSAPAPNSEESSAPASSSEDSSAPAPNSEESSAPAPNPEDASAPSSEDSGAPALNSEESGAPAPSTEDSGAPAPSMEDSGAPAPNSEDAPESGDDMVETSPDVPAVVLHEVPSVDPDTLEEAIAEQQEISYETAPEHGGPEDKPPSPKPEEKKEDDAGQQETTEQSVEQIDEQAPEQNNEQNNEQTTEEPAPEQQQQQDQDQQPEQQQQGEEQKPAEQEPEQAQQEQGEAQEVKQDEEAQPAPETVPEPEQTEEKPSDTQQETTTETTEQTQETTQEEQKPAEGESEAQAEQTESKPDSQPEAEPEQKEEPAQEEEAKTEEPAETQQAETTEEKKEETAEEKKDETKTEEQKTEGEAQKAE